MDTALLTNPRAFILAGNATFTLSNTRTGNRFTYRVRQCEDKPGLYFVAVLNGPDNERNYAYLGTLYSMSTMGANGPKEYRHGRKSKIGEEAPSAQAFAWLWRHLDALPPCVVVAFAGTCGKCGRKLTVLESITNGFGPDCMAQMMA